MKPQSKRKPKFTKAWQRRIYEYINSYIYLRGRKPLFSEIEETAFKYKIPCDSIELKHFVQQLYKNT